MMKRKAKDPDAGAGPIILILLNSIIAICVWLSLLNLMKMICSSS